MVPRLLVFLVSLGVRALRVLCRSKAELVIENLALRQQIATLVRARTRPAIDDAERAFIIGTQHRSRVRIAGEDRRAPGNEPGDAAGRRAPAGPGTARARAEPRR